MSDDDKEPLYSVGQYNYAHDAIAVRIRTIPSRDPDGKITGFTMGGPVAYTDTREQAERLAGILNRDNDWMRLVLEAVTTCGDHVEATPIMVALAKSFPDHYAAIEAAFEEHYSYGIAFGRFNLAYVMEKDKTDGQ